MSRSVSKELINSLIPIPISCALLLINSLNLLAEDGWELVEVDRANDALTYYIFKRKIEAN